jgi:hypothetical protein
LGNLFADYPILYVLPRSCLTYILFSDTSATAALFIPFASKFVFAVFPDYAVLILIGQQVNLPTVAWI